MSLRLECHCPAHIQKVECINKPNSLDKKTFDEFV